MFALGHRYSPAVKLFFEFLQLNRMTTQKLIVRETFLPWNEAEIVLTKNLITLLYVIVGLPGWPSGTGGGLQTRYTWVRFPPPAPKCNMNGGIMVEKIVEETFEALFALEDLREVLRKTAPFHNLTEEQKEEVKAILDKVRKALDEIEEEIK